MNEDKSAHYIEKSREKVALKVQELRKERHWTQAELSRRLGLSQSRLSEIERGSGSFTAEQFLTILKLFNVTASDFAPEPRGQDSELQNALARLGALHLQESTNVLPSERLSGASDVIREAIVASQSPRLITALGPVLVGNIDHVNLKKLHLQLTEAGLGRRLAWLIENTLEAIRRELPGVSPAPWRRVYSRAQVVLGSFLDFLKVESSEEATRLRSWSCLRAPSCWRASTCTALRSTGRVGLGGRRHPDRRRARLVRLGVKNGNRPARSGTETSSAPTS